MASLFNQQTCYAMLCYGSSLPDFKQYFWPFREKRKMDKAAARNKKAEDERREKEEAAAAAAAAEAATAEAASKERKTRQVEKKAMQKQRSKLRTLSSSLVSSESHSTLGRHVYKHCRHASCDPKEGHCHISPNFSSFRSVFSRLTPDCSLWVCDQRLHLSTGLAAAV